MYSIEKQTQLLSSWISQFGSKVRLTNTKKTGKKNRDKNRYMVMYSTITPKYMMKTIKLSYPTVSLLPKDRVAK